jgi:uncharacterized repeat protein (TIGR04076 family)
MRLVIRVVEIKGSCPVYRLEDEIIIEGGYRLNLKETDNLCMHSLIALLPYYVALSKGITL